MAPKVTSSAIFPVCAVFQTTLISPGRSDLTAAKISTAPSVGIATAPTSPDSATRITSIHSPAKTDDKRLQAPADTFSAVDPTDPPTGVPWNSPETRLPTPCPMKSPLACDGEPSGLGVDSATPAPCTSAIAAIASAPVTTPILRSDRCGRASGGRPVGIAPSSLTVATLVLPRIAMTAVGTTTAISDPSSANLVRASPNNTSNALIPTAAAAQLMSPGGVAMYQAFWLATPPPVSTPSRSGSWPKTMLTDTPVRKPNITERDTNRM